MKLLTKFVSNAPPCPKLLWNTAACTALLAASSLLGCSGNFGSVGPAAAAVTANSIKGSAMGGQQPVTGARVYAFAAGATGYASASVSLLDKTAAGISTDSSGNGYVLTDATGHFTANWNCPHATDQVYMLTSGGNPGMAPGTDNTASVMMAALGACSSLSASTFVIINELSTVAAATALQQFMTDSTHIGASATNANGITNAFTTALNMVSIGQTIANGYTPAGNGTVPVATLDTLANILSACVNTAGGSSTQCTGLFTNATPTSGPAPVDTLTAALNIAKNPTANVANLYLLSPPTPPFQPGLSAAPSDWTIGINYTVSTLLAEPGYLAIDGTGNVWVTNRASEKSPYTGLNSLIKLSPFGEVLSGATGYAASKNIPEGIAIDDLGNVWQAGSNPFTGTSSIFRINNTGTTTSGFPFFGGDSPQGIAVDKYGNAWVSNFGNGSGTTVMYIGKDGFVLNSGVSSPGFAGPQGVALDSVGDIWSAGQASSSLLKIKGTDFSVLSGSGSGFTGGGLNNPAGVAMDGSNRAWVANTFGGAGNATLSLFNSDGSAVSTSAGFGTVAKGYENLLAIDGAGTAWVTSCGTRCVGNGNPDAVVHVGTTGALLNTSSGFRTPGLDAPQGIGIDASGNLWIGNSAGQYNADPGTITEIVGAAAPVKTPLQAALKTGLLGQRP